MATLCSSPPESLEMSLSMTSVRSKSSAASSTVMRSCTLESRSLTTPLAARGILSTYCGLTATLTFPAYTLSR